MYNKSNYQLIIREINKGMLLCKNEYQKSLMRELIKIALEEYDKICLLTETLVAGDSLTAPSIIKKTVHQLDDNLEHYIRKTYWTQYLSARNKDKQQEMKEIWKSTGDLNKVIKDFKPSIYTFKAKVAYKTIQKLRRKLIINIFASLNRNNTNFKSDAKSQRIMNYSRNQLYKGFIDDILGFYTDTIYWEDDCGSYVYYPEVDATITISTDMIESKENTKTINIDKIPPLKHAPEALTKEQFLQVFGPPEDSEFVKELKVKAIEGILEGSKTVIEKVFKPSKTDENQQIIDEITKELIDQMCKDAGIPKKYIYGESEE